jgi:1-acyl-sn-glycerol-3-phosphate acyltransferase
MHTEPDLWWKTALPLARAATTLALRLRIEGAGHIPPDGPAIVACNHVSFLDSVFIPLAAWRRRRMIAFLSAAEFFEMPVVGWGLRKARQIPVRRGNRDQRAIDMAEAWLGAGGLLGIFPEGKINRDPDAGLLPGKRGVARLALETGAPVVPAATWGGQYRLPRGGITFRRKPWRLPVSLVLGEPLPVERHDDPTDEDLRRETDRVMTAIGDLLGTAKDLTGLERPA